MKNIEFPSTICDFIFVKFIPALLKSFKNLTKTPCSSGRFTKIEVLSFPLGLFSKSLKIKNLVLLLSLSSIFSNKIGRLYNFAATCAQIAALFGSFAASFAAFVVDSTGISSTSSSPKFVKNFLHWSNAISFEYIFLISEILSHVVASVWWIFNITSATIFELKFVKPFIVSFTIPFEEFSIGTTPNFIFFRL